jgi:hypothetical protein
MKMYRYLLVVVATIIVTSKSEAYHLQVENYSPFTVHVHAHVTGGCSSHDWCVPPPPFGQYWFSRQSLPSGAPYGAGEPKSIGDACNVKSVYAEICPSNSCTGDARLCAAGSSTCSLLNCKLSQDPDGGYIWGGYTFKVFGDPRIGLTDLEVSPH